MTPTEWLRINRGKLGSEFERKFVLDVLSRVLDFDFDALEGQLSFKDIDGKQRYCDFAVTEGKEVRIAMEVDGYDKTGRGRGMTRGEFVDWERRHAALVSQGWDVLRFANLDVRDRPDKCAEYINLLLRRERQKAGHINNLRQSQEALQEKFEVANKVAAELKKMKAALASEKRKKNRKDDGTTKGDIELVRKMERQVKAAETANREKVRLERELAAIRHQLTIAEQVRPLNKEELARLDELNEAQQHIEILKEDASTMKTTIWAFTALLGIIILALIIGRPGENGGGPNPPPKESPPIDSPTLGSSCDAPLSWRQARDVIGQTVALSGQVIDVRYKDDVNGRPTFITLGAPYPNANRLELVIWGDNRDQFGDDLEKRIEGRPVCVIGEVETYKGKLEIELRQAGQLVIDR